MEKRNVRRLSSQEKFKIVGAIIKLSSEDDQVRTMDGWMGAVMRTSGVLDIPASSLRQFLRDANIQPKSKSNKRAPKVSAADKIRVLRRILFKLVSLMEVESALTESELKFISNEKSGGGLDAPTQQRFDVRG